jgi:hypothetical protein
MREISDRPFIGWGIPSLFQPTCLTPVAVYCRLPQKLVYKNQKSDPHSSQLTKLLSKRVVILSVY